MTLVLEATVTPFYGQVDLSDLGATGYPQWESGGERFVSSGQAIVVATRGDAMGDVLIQVSDDDSLPRADGLQLLVKCQIYVASGELEVGNTPGNHRQSVTVSAGYVDVAVYIDPPNLPERVVFVLPGACVAG